MYGQQCSLVNTVSIQLILTGTISMSMSLLNMRPEANTSSSHHPPRPYRHHLDESVSTEHEARG